MQVSARQKHWCYGAFMYAVCRCSYMPVGLYVGLYVGTMQADFVILGRPLGVFQYYYLPPIVNPGSFY